MRGVMKSALAPLLLFVFYFSLSCGRIIEESEAEQGRREKSQENGRISVIVPEDVIKSQRLMCEDVLNCPEGLSKLIIRSKEKQHQCIGNLIAPDKILTSASCLPQSLRIPKLSCSDSIFAVFAKSGVHPEEIVGCRYIEYVNNNLFKESALWHSDLAVIKIARSLSRLPARLSLQGVQDGEKLQAWRIENKSSHIGVIRKENCKALLKTYLNPLSDSPYSSMFVGSHCYLGHSDSGAPLYRQGEIIGVMSKEMRKQIYDILIGSGRVDTALSSYYHINNMSCFEEIVSGAKADASRDCLESKTTHMLDQARGKMLSSMHIHQEAMEQARDELANTATYFRWKIGFKYDEVLKELHSYYERPKCIIDSKSWIKQYRTWRGKIWTFANVRLEIPKFIFRVRLDEYLRPVSYVDQSQSEVYRIQFNPYDAHVYKKTYVTLLWDIEQEQPPSITFDDIEGEC